jgi:hypothetical protein
VTKPPTRKDIADWCSKLYKELPDAMVRHKYYVVILGFMTKYKLEFDFFYFAILFFFRSGSLSLCCRFIVGIVIVPGVNDYCLAAAQILVMLSPL